MIQLQLEKKLLKFNGFMDPAVHQMCYYSYVGKLTVENEPNIHYKIGESGKNGQSN